MPEKKVVVNSSGKPRKESGGKEPADRKEEVEEAEGVAKKQQPEVRTLPPAPKNNPWKKPAMNKEKEEAEQPKVNF
jgi:hypothetical protein